MDIIGTLRSLKAGEDLLSPKRKRELDERGFTVYDGLIDGAWLESLRLRFEELCEAEGPGAGIEVHQETGTRGLSDLANKGAVFDRVYTHPVLLASVYHVLDRDFRLSSLNARDALPGEGHQALHADWRSDYDGRFHVCSSVWLLG